MPWQLLVVGAFQQGLAFPSPDKNMSVRYRLRRVEDNHIIELSKRTTLIGRSQDAQITFENPGVSSFHASLERNPEGWKLTDLGSTNGTIVNGELIKERQLVAGDSLQFNGSIALVYEPVPGTLPDVLLDPEATLPGNIAEVLAETQGAIAAVERSVASVREEYATFAGTILNEQAEAKQERRQTADSLDALTSSFEYYRSSDTARFDRLTGTLTTIAQWSLVIVGVMSLVTFATINADQGDRRGPIAKTVDWIGGPGETISLVGVLLATSSWAVSRAKQLQIRRRTGDTGIQRATHQR